MAEADNVRQLRNSNPLLSQLQDELYEVVCRSKYDNTTLCETVGVLEFLKWNIINRSD